LRAPVIVAVTGGSGGGWRRAQLGVALLTARRRRCW